MERVALLEARMTELETLRQPHPSSPIGAFRMTTGATPLGHGHAHSVGLVFLKRPLPLLAAVECTLIASIALAKSHQFEMELVRAVLAIQLQTRQSKVSRSLVGQYLKSNSLNHTIFKFRTICRSAERLGLVTMGNGGQHQEWISLPNA